MTPIERFWLDLIDGRKHHIQTLYGTDAMERYRPHPMEREYFINNNGHLCNHPEVLNYNRRFYDYCEQNYQAQKQRYEKKLLANKKKYEASGSYKALKAEREELVAYIRGITVRDASKEETHTRTTEKESR
jgi:hypothetical protein